MNVDYIIVGQGIAGSCLALQLDKLGKKVAVFDQPEKNHCSRVAAGMFNPLTGNKMTKTWLADECFSYLFEFYRCAETITSSKFFYPMPIYRPFLTVEEQNEWMANGENPEYKSFICSTETNRQFEQVNDPLGGLMLTGTGFVSTVTFLDAVAEWLRQNHQYFPEKFNHESLEITEDAVIYNGIRAEKIIFCEGINTLRNPWFARAGIKPLKGEIIVIKSAWNKQVILNRGVYMVPSSAADSEFKVGSTYVRNTEEPGSTEAGRIELEEKLKSLVRLPYLVKEQHWGIRPVSGDKKPVLGHHPDSERLVIFNGLGSKGVSLAPYFSHLLSQWMEGGSPLNKAVNVSRFKLLY